VTSFKRLTRGVKLLLEHIYSPINEALDTLTKGHVPLADYEKKNGTFRLSFYVPFTRHSGFGADRSTDFPFILPPLQDQFNSSPENINHYRLIEVSVGQDTRCEPASIAGPQNLAAMPTYGIRDTENIPNYRLAIFEKEIAKGENNPVENEIYSAAVPAIALINPYDRFNPLSQSGISIPVRPDRSYMVRIFTEAPGPGTLGTGWSGQMTSLFVTLKFSTNLISRDTEPASQNATYQVNVSSNPVVTPVPLKDTPIEADSATGVNTALKVIDAIIDSKLVGGLTRAGNRYGFDENLRDDACYDVIAIPLFAGWGDVRGGVITNHLSCQNANSLPFCAAGAGGLHTMDRAIIPLQHPISIHHVILAVNYSTAPTGVAFNTGSFRPTTTVTAGVNLTHEVGVGLLSGMRADTLATQQVAHVSWTPATRSNFIIDQMDSRHINATGETFGYSWDLMSCPLVGDGSVRTGVGYYAQGDPIYAVAGMNHLPRSNIGQPHIASLTVGAEQALDIRWKISDAVSDPLAWTSPESVIGYRGHWVYLICKKLLR